MIRINLLPVRSSRKRETAIRQLLIAIVGLAVIVVGILYVDGTISNDIDEMESQNAQIKAEIERLKKVIGQVEEFEKKKDALQKKLEIIQTLKARKTGPVHMLDEIATNIPEKCWLTSISEVNKKVTLTGVSINNEVIADFISKLEDSGYFEEVYLVSTQQKQDKEGLKLKQFSVTARMTTPEETRMEQEHKAEKG